MSFQWICQPKAEALLLQILEQYCLSSPSIRHLQEELAKHTSTRLFDWLDHLVVPYSSQLERELDETGFLIAHAAPTYRVFFHPGAQLPKLAMRDAGQSLQGVAVKVDQIAEFLMARGMTSWIEGSPFSEFRRAVISTDQGVTLWAVERRAGYALEPTYTEEGVTMKFLEAKERWMTRPRGGENEAEAIQRTLTLAEEIVVALGEEKAACLILECERMYWQARNTAGQIQKNRQDRLGMGWANHDHHTFRSSRVHFSHLVRLFEMLGFHCRERFYAGEEAGWGAQVMENPRAGLVLFLDLDLAPHELEMDFAHHPLPELAKLGTVGLWCALHGDSLLKGGMHHLEAQFYFEELSKDLEHHGVGMMEPFSNFSYLKQAFTHGEIWPVDPRRVHFLIEKGLISHEEADKFLKYGAVGSHLENLQRREGYKGFNQKNVSIIIKKTDPRNLVEEVLGP